MNGTILVTGLVHTTDDAVKVVQKILEIGYPREEISVVMTDATRRQQVDLETGNQAAAGAGVGGAVGGAFGAVLAATAAIGMSVIIPGLGWVVAGPIVAAFAGAGAGGVAGGAIGALVGAGIPEVRAQLYETGLAQGGILIGVHAQTISDAGVLEGLFGTYGADEIRIAQAEPGAVHRAA